MLRMSAVLAAFAVVFAIVVHAPRSTADPAANPKDPAREDLSRVDYPSHREVEWEPRFIRPHDTLESMFGKDWPVVARFNRIDRRHTYPGMTIKVPLDIEKARNYSPLPEFYEPAKRYGKYILVSLTEQWLGAYERGKLRLSFPAATGKKGHDTPTGFFHVDARHREHTSSLYKTEDGEEQYPMDYAFRFHFGADDISYWIHSRDLPGKPASHGCIGLYNEEMQKRVYGIPEDPVLLDAQNLYEWAVGEADFGYDSGELEELEGGPFVEVVGETPVFNKEPLRRISSAR